MYSELYTKTAAQPVNYSAYKKVAVGKRTTKPQNTTLEEKAKQPDMRC